MPYDCAVIGTGPAGLSAALNLKIRRKNFIWIGNRSLSEKASKAEQILNYPGLPSVTGAQLHDAFLAHAKEMELTITEQMVNSIVPISGTYALMAGSEFYETKTLILSIGASLKAVIPGEEAFLGRGVSYCATCDGNLYRGRTIAVICSNARFEHEVSFLADLAKRVYYFPSYREVSVRAENLEIMQGVVREIIGGAKVTGIRLKDDTILAADGVFCLRDSVALTSLLPGLKTEDGHICVDRAMATNLPGVYAAGDCTGRPYQYAKAVGEGNVAAHSVLSCLAQIK